MADVEMDVQSLIDYSIVFNQPDAENLFEDLKYDMAKKDFKKAGKTIFNYQINIYNIPVDQLPYDIDGYAECLEEIYEDYPFTEKDIKDYDYNQKYIRELASKMIEAGLIDEDKFHLTLGTARLIREDMQKGDIGLAADLVEEVSSSPRFDIITKLGNIAAQLSFLGESDNELDDF